jgi:hypothetical protein
MVLLLVHWFQRLRCQAGLGLGELRVAIVGKRVTRTSFCGVPDRPTIVELLSVMADGRCRVAVRWRSVAALSTFW